MALLGSGRKFTFAHIKKLRQSEAEVLKVLTFWDYSRSRANPTNISLKLEISESAVVKALQYLQLGRGLVRIRGSGKMKSWVIPPSVKADIIEILEQEIKTDSTEKTDSEPAQSARVE